MLAVTGLVLELESTASIKSVGGVIKWQEDGEMELTNSLAKDGKHPQG